MKVYVSTYGKYNNGSLAGDWIDLTEHTKESFREACVELHKDEVDPEFMFQDFDEVPDCFRDECSIPDELWEYIELTDDDREVWSAYADAIGVSIADVTFADARYAYCGRHDSVEAFCENRSEECGDLRNLPDYLRYAIDWESVWNCTARFDFVESGGMFFYR